MPRLLLLFEYPTMHGGEHSLLACVPQVRAAGFELFASAPSRGPLAAALEASGVELHASGSPERTEQPSQAERRARLAAVIRRLRPDLVHANSLSMSRLAGPVTAELGVPSLGHLRDIVTISRRAAADINRHNRILAVSQATRDWHIARGLDPAKVHVCYNGVDLNEFQPRPPSGFLHRELGLSATAGLIGSIGQLVMRKGLDVALEAARSVFSEQPDLHWLVVGERFSQKAEAVEYEQRLRQAAKISPLTGRVHFLGVRGDVNRILNELMLLIHAARQEPLGRVLLEAAASGVPLVATDVGGTSEILPPDEFGEILVPAGDPPAMARAAGRLLGDPGLRGKVAAGLRRRAAQAFERAAAAGRLVEHYLAVAALKLS